MTWLALVALLACPVPDAVADLKVEPARDYQVGDLPIDVTITAVDDKGKPVRTFCGPVQVTGAVSSGKPITHIEALTAGTATLNDLEVTGDPIAVTAGDGPGAVTTTYQPALRRIPGWLSIVPPLVAVIMAILLRQALLALFFGIWIGALFVHGYNPLTALLRCFDTYLPTTLVDPDHAAIVCFTMALGGMVGIISKSGGTRALVEAISARASNRRSGMLTAWFSGLVVFFDDYANCLLVGNTVRPFTDRMRISREKLAYIVDSTAAPVATVALVSTWIGFQIGLFKDAIPDVRGYDVFLAILPYSFYSFFTLAFVFTIAVTLRDFGPMARAERRAFKHGQVLRPGAQPLMDRELTDMAPDNPEAAHWSLALVPVVSVIVIVMIGLYVSGRGALDNPDDATLSEIIAAASSNAVLLWASFGGSVIAFAMAAGRRAITPGGAIDAWVSGVKSMVIAVLILVLAWALGAMCKNHLMTGEWVISQVAPGPRWLPVITFFVSAVIALATGSSFGTMTIVIPIVAPMAWLLTGDSAGLEPDAVESIRYATLAAVLSGAVFGDHCSPISDTTIMSSMSSASDHMDHVRTQAPYALICAGAAALIGFVPAGWGVSPMITVPVGIAVLVIVIRVLGRRVDDGERTAPDAAAG